MMEPLHPSDNKSHADSALPVRPDLEPDPARPATSSPASSTPDRLTLLQQAFLLEQLATHGAGGMTGGEVNRKIGAPARRELQLSSDVAGQVRNQLKEQGYLATRKNGRKILFELTEAGRTYLTTLERPAANVRARQSGPVDESGITDEVRDAQKAFLLLQLLDADGRRLPKGKANAIPKRLSAALGLKPAIANYRRARLAEQGYIRITLAGKSEEYSLTPDGLDYLVAGATHLQHAEFTFKGRTLNALVAAARELSLERDRAAAPSAPQRRVPTRPELAEAVLAEFQELRRERYSRSGLVPIHEVRQRIAERFGPAAARHDLLDDVIQDLWRQHRLGLEAISDLADATQEQLNDSIQGISGTLFYLEAPREQPVTSEPLPR